MWCSTCQQDVPALGSASEGTLRCGKCGDSFVAGNETDEPQNSDGRGAGAHVSCQADQRPLPAPSRSPCSKSRPIKNLLPTSLLLEDDWALEAEIRSVQRMLNSLKARPSLAPPENARHAHVFPPRKNGGQAAARKTESRQSPRKPERRPHLAAWTILSLGLVVFVGGAALLGWSLIVKRNDLWPISLPLTIIGQAALIFGVVLQLDSLWNSSRQTAEVLNELDGELKSVREAAALLSASQPGPAPLSALQHAAGGAPQMVLADLKQQMDLVGQQLTTR